MLMRLLFAIQMSFDADILIFDEWLSVGDEGFQSKCRDIILERLDKSKIFILASHNAFLVNSICNIRIYIDKGSIVSIERA
jgi:lipopolysaccharide transport system ATP-binding protein